VGLASAYIGIDDNCCVDESWNVPGGPCMHATSGDSRQNLTAVF
jgi:hypothetical protein